MKFKFALVEGERREAQRGLSGKCPLCDDAMIAKCGEVRVWHWAHRGIRTCDTWWEPETEWHRAWKNQFPKDWQERIHWSESGEKHIADVKTERGIVLEFQHSNLHRDERESREMFYQKMVWVVDGLRLKRDRSRFFASLTRASILKAKPLTYSLPTNEGALLRDWINSHNPVFFDFGEKSEPGDPLLFHAPVLWRLEPRNPKGEAHLSPVLKTSFLNKYVRGLGLKGIDYSAELRAVCAALLQQAPPPRPLMELERYMAKQRARRRRFLARHREFLKQVFIYSVYPARTDSSTQLAPALAPGFSFGPNLGPKLSKTGRNKATLDALAVLKSASKI